MDIPTIAATAPSAGDVLRALISFSIKASIVLAAAAGLAFLLRRASAAARHSLWVIAIGAVLLLPIFNSFLPPIELPLLPADLLGPDDGVAMNQNSGNAGLINSSQPAFLFTGSPFAGLYPWSSSSRTGIEELEIEAGSNSTHALSWRLFVLIGWALGFLIVSVLFTANRIKAHILARGSVPAGDAWMRRASNIASLLGIKRKIRFLVCPGMSAPLIFGFIRPVILLPEHYKLWSVDTTRIVLLHELTHIKRADLLTLLVAQITCALQWFNPFVWLAARTMLKEREHACDDAVLELGTRPSDYAEILLKIAASMKIRQHPLWAGAAMARHNNFKERVMAILDSKRNRHVPGKRIRLISAAIAAIALIPLAAFQPWSRALAEGENLSADSYMEKAREVKVDILIASDSIEQGDPFLVGLVSSDQVQATGEFLGRQFTFHREGDKYFALVGADYNATPGKHVLSVTAHPASGRTILLNKEITISKRQLRKAMVNFTPKQIMEQSEKDILTKAFANSSPESRWQLPFLKPLEGRVSFGFGHSLVINNEEEIVHQGVDISVPEGTPLKCSNYGRVVLARKLAVSGNTVIIDHGAGIMTGYMHLSRIDVKEGQEIDKGEVLGLSGTTGRSTAPHLHWQLIVNGVFCDPLKLATLQQ